MAGIFTMGGPQFDIDDLKIAINNLDGNFSDVTDVPSVQMVTMNHRVRSREGTGDGAITAVASKYEALEMTIRNLSIPFDVVGLFTGANVVEETVSGSDRRTVDMSLRRFPYIGMSFRCYAGDSVSGTAVFVPYLKVMDAWDWRFEEREFVIPEIKFLALTDPVLVDDVSEPLLYRIREYEVMPALTLPIA